MPTKISFRYFDTDGNNIGKWRPNGRAARYLSIAAMGRGGGSAAHIQWIDELSGYESRMYVNMQEIDRMSEDMHEYRRKANPLKGRKQGYKVRASRGLSAKIIDEARGQRTHTVPPEFTSLTIEHESVEEDDEGAFY